MPRKPKKITPKVLAKTCGNPCWVAPPDGYRFWVHYLKENRDCPKPYRSWLEFRLFNGPLASVSYEPFKVDYEVREQKKYVPDGVEGHFLIEIKGRFRTRVELNKYLHIRNSLWKKELVFIFTEAGIALPGAVKRKDGTKMTNEEWAEKNGFRYCFEAEAGAFLEQLRSEL